MPAQVDNQRIATTTLLLYGRLLLMAVSLFMIRVVLNTLFGKNYGIFNVIGIIVLMFAFVNGALTLANGQGASGSESLSMKTTVKPIGNSFPTSGQSNPIRTNLN